MKLRSFGFDSLDEIMKLSPEEQRSIALINNKIDIHNRRFGDKR